MSLEDAPRIHPVSVAEWRTWLEEHHETATGVWVVGWRPATGRPTVAYEDQVLEALSYGWIDATARRLDDERSMLYFAPRRPGSVWARSNKARIERLREEGRMTPAGEAVVERAVADRSWSRYDEVDALVVPDDLAAAFARHPGSRERWEAFPPSARRSMLGWVVQARRAATRDHRIEEIARLAALNLRADQHLHPGEQPPADPPGPPRAG